MKKKRNNAIWLASSEQIQILLNESFNYKEVIGKLGLRPATSNYRILKIRIKEDNLDLTQFELNLKEFQRGIAKGLSKKKIDLELVLVEHSTYNRASLKKRLVEEGYLEYKCYGDDCGITEWKNKPISLQLEHINGVEDDNRIENLVLLCPNCHSQTDTFAGKKNKGKTFKEVKKCKNCSAELSDYRATYCVPCSRIKSRKVERPSLEQLIKDVKELGYRGTGRKYGVWDNTIRKWIKRYNEI